MELRKYQQEFIDRIRFKLSQGERRIVCVLPTGGGKTVVFCHICRQVIMKKKRVLIVTHRREIFSQIKKALHKEEIHSGSIMSGRPIQNDTIQVGMVQVVANRLSYIQKPDLIIFDEAHHIRASSWLKILNHWNDTTILGFTATPERLDGKGLKNVFPCMVEGSTISTLIKEKWLSPVAVYGAKNKVFSEKKFKTVAGDFSKSEQSDVIDQNKNVIYSDVIKEYKEKLNGLPALVFTPSIKKSYEVAELFTVHGFTAKALTGETPDNERQSIIDGLGSGRINVVTSCDVISEGVDIPVVVGIILLRKTKSLTFYLQAIGRGLRPCTGKKIAIVLDHANNTAIHGHPVIDRKWSLDGRSSRKKDNTIQTTSCPKCYMILPGNPPQCPSCGHVFAESKKERSEYDVDMNTPLSILLPTDLENSRQIIIDSIDQAKNTQDSKEKTRLIWRELYRIMRENPNDVARRSIDSIRKAMGYKPGWSYMVWQKILIDRQKKRQEKQFSKTTP